MILAITYVLLFFYVSLIAVYLYGWLRIPEYHEVDTQSSLTYTIIIPARNEEHHIYHSLQSICMQHFDSKRYHIMVVDDYSEDKTVEKVKEFISAHPTFSIELCQLEKLDNPHIKQKKQAVDYAIRQSKTDYVILTDADCTRGENWLSVLDSFASEKAPAFVYAPVQFKANNLFETIQSFEFAGLVGIGASAIQLGYPNMCSASNLLVKRDSYVNVQPFENNFRIPSGDDVFMLHAIHKVLPNDVYFLKNKKATVYTHPNETLKQLVEQRRRWVSKSTSYEYRYVTLILIAAYFFNAAIVYYCLVEIRIGLFLLGAKMLIEGAFLFPVLYFFRQVSYLLYLPIAEVFHIMYVLTIGVWSQIGTYNWKKRKHDTLIKH